MGHHGYNDEVSVRFPSLHRLEDYRKDGTARQGGGLEVPPHRGLPRGGGNVSNSGLCQAVKGYHLVVNFYKTDI